MGGLAGRPLNGFKKPSSFIVVGMPGIEPGTSSLSVTRSNHLSYTPFRSSWILTETRIPIKHKKSVCQREVEMSYFQGSRNVLLSGKLKCPIWRFLSFDL